MMESLRSRLRRVSTAAEAAGFAAGVLNRTGFLGALSPGGLVAFARQARGTKVGPHLALMLHAANKPEKIALVDGDRRFTYAEMDLELNRIAHGLVELGVRPGDRVACMLPNCAEYVLLQQALPRIGATAVQVGYRLKGKEIAHILDNAEPRVVVYHERYAGEMDRAREAAGGPGPERLVVVGAEEGSAAGAGWEAVLEGRPTEPPRVAGEDETGGVIVYTSGTTGKPKGANRSYAKTGLEAVADFMARVGMTHEDRHLVICPLYHSAAPAFVSMMYGLGATCVVMDHFEPEATLALIERERITSAFMVPTMLGRLAALPPEVRRRYDTSSLRWVLSGAAPLPTETARRFMESFGRILYNFYGATETGLVTLAGPDDHLTHPGTVGTLLRGNEVRLLDEEGREVPTGEVGEFWARNSMIISGYHGNREATERSMREGFFSVGDLAYTDRDGYYYLASRKHDMVISGGVNIYPAEIEEHLHTHPNVVDVAVVGVPDPDWGETLKAFVVPRRGADLSEEDVVTYCREGLADYKRPRKVEFLDELPRNPTGKVLKRQLREQG